MILQWITESFRYLKVNINNYADYKSVNKVMNAEFYMMMVVSNMLKIPVCEFIYCGDCRKEVKDNFDNLCIYFGVITGYCADISEQKNGTDAMVRGCGLDFKIGDNDTSNRAGFAVTYNENKNRWDIDNYHHDRLLVMYVPLTGKVYIFPLRLIAMIINKKVYDLPFKQSYYDDDKIFKHYNFNGKDVFYIDCDCIQDCMPTFMKKYCDNKNIRDLLANGNVAEVDKEEYSAYMENIKNIETCNVKKFADLVCCKD